MDEEVDIAEMFIQDALQDRGDPGQVGVGQYADLHGKPLANISRALKGKHVFRRKELNKNWDFVKLNLGQASVA